jgi:hypothetical protein
MPVTLPQGTKEYLFLDVSDLLAQLLTLDGTTPKFDVKDQGDVLKYTQANATNVGMRMYCLIDTSAAHPQGLWAAGNYRLYVNFTTAPELPRLGPYAFTVDAS